MSAVRELLGAATDRLVAAGVASARFDAEELLAFVLGVRRLELRFVDRVTAGQQETYESLVARRAERVPLQHLTGTAPFRRLELAVGPGVFVPRPETESVAEAAILFARRRTNPVVVDLCTGSGAIAAAIASEVPDARVFACEVDPGAHAWAVKNLSGTHVTLELSDAKDALTQLDGTVDVVVSNPPYIPMAAYESVQREVRDHDPALALWSGEDGLDAIRVVERTAARLLRPGGHVVVEHADVQGESAPAVFAATGEWTLVRDNPDLAGRPRFVTAVRA
ncbi:MAG TPA: peptide chain release factor N(5)-glutamine methyltransferase [Actinopolymorphaceae bacterium]